MKKIQLYFIFFMSIVISTTSYANNQTAKKPATISPHQIIKDINQLYMSLIIDDLNKTTQTNIICQQIPNKINDYKKADPNDKTKTATLLKNLQENIEQTRKFLNISCTQKTMSKK